MGSPLENGIRPHRRYTHAFRPAPQRFLPMADRFYTNELLSPGEFVLEGAEAHHMGTVRRFVPGNRVVLFNGDGGEYPSDVVSVGKKRVVLQVLEREEPKREDSHKKEP